MPGFTFPFSLTNKRVYHGGWSREVTARELPIAKVDSTSFHESTTVAVAIVTVHPGACANCTGTRTRTSGSTTSAAKDG